MKGGDRPGSRNAGRPGRQAPTRSVRRVLDGPPTPPAHAVSGGSWKRALNSMRRWRNPRTCGPGSGSESDSIELKIQSVRFRPSLTGRDHRAGRRRCGGRSHLFRGVRLSLPARGTQDRDRDHDHQRRNAQRPGPPPALAPGFLLIGGIENERKKTTDALAGETVAGQDRDGASRPGCNHSPIGSSIALEGHVRLTGMSRTEPPHERSL